MGAPTYTLPTNNSDTATEEPKITLALSELKTLLTANLGDANVAAGAFTNASLASPMTGVYRDIFSIQMSGAGANQSTGTYWFGVIGTGDIAFKSNGGGTTTAAGILGLRYLRAADYAVDNKTTKLRMCMQIVSGSTSPGTTVVTGGLYPITISSGQPSMGTVVSNTTVASSGLATNTVKTFVSSDANFPADGAFAPGIVISTAALPADHQVHMQLQVRNV